MNKYTNRYNVLWINGIIDNKLRLVVEDRFGKQYDNVIVLFKEHKEHK